MVQVKYSLTAASEKICSMKKKLDLHALAVKLCEGEVVFFQGLFIRARAVTPGHWSCFHCNMDCLCLDGIKDLCMECDNYDGKMHILYLVRER